LNINIFIHLRLGLPSGLFHSGFPTKTIYASLLFPISVICPTHIILEIRSTYLLSGSAYGQQNTMYSCFTLYRETVLGSTLQSTGIRCRPLFYKHNDVSEGRLPPQSLSHGWAVYIKSAPCLALLTYLLTYLLTQWSKVLLEKLTGSKLVKQFPAF
jgi:hypothetical protein